MDETKIKQNSLQAWILAARPKTLSGAAVPVLIGLSLAFTDAKEYGDDVFRLDGGNTLHVLRSGHADRCQFH